jgi:hypothetical protein
MRSFGLFVIAVLTAVLFAYPATASPASVVATINGGGTAIMDPESFAQGTTAFSIHATLYEGDTPNGGPAKGHIDCVDQQGSSTIPGNIFGEVTSWVRNPDGTITLNVVGKFVSQPGGHPVPQDFSVTIQRFGGAGVGHWTLSVPTPVGPFTFCIETLSSGQIVMRDS